MFWYICQEAAKYFTVAAEKAVSVLPNLVRYFKLEVFRCAVFASSMVKLRKTEK